jgi:putative ABC transport system substrate-binding protein
VRRPRRRLLLAAGVVLLAGPALAAAQGTRVRRIGVLMPSTPAATRNLVSAFEEGLREQGYAPGRSVLVDYRYTEGASGRVATLARDLEARGAEVIVTTTDPVVRAAAQETRQAAIVMVNASDPVGNHLVRALAQPGGRITGLTNHSPEIAGKRVQLMTECVPATRRLAYLWTPALHGAQHALAEIESAAARLGLALEPLAVGDAPDIAAAFARLEGALNTAVMAQAPNPMLYTERSAICGLAKARRLPSIFSRIEYVGAGGLMSYGPDVPAMYRRAASYVHRILEGASPASLPVEQPSKFELAINVRTARAIGVNIPQNVLARVDTIVQ